MTLHTIATRNGLLLQRSSEGDEAYAVAHRSFQEFLAGYHLAGQDGHDRLCLERSPHIHWHKALRLMTGYQVLDQNQPGPTLLLAQELLRRSPLERALAGELLGLVGRERAENYRPDHVAPGGLWEQACTALENVMLSGKPLAAPAPLRARVGMALGVLRYGALESLTHSAATPPAPDPRLPFTLVSLPAQETPHWAAALATYWRRIEPGPFWYGDDSEDEPLQPVSLNDTFAITRYPITNADFARFIAAGGYAERRLWTKHGWTYIEPGGYRFQGEPERIMRPRFWTDHDLNNPLQPVVGVSWYEAAAYCAWLTAQGHAQGWLPKTEEIRLPTSLEWEQAARHTDQRRYPWGRTRPGPERANYDATEIAYTAPVGIFPRGAAVCGVLDMAGNVDEWTASRYGEETPGIAPEKTLHLTIV
jgi:formylglycine-generating enzyme required for sulfatase activity